MTSEAPTDVDGSFKPTTKLADVEIPTAHASTPEPEPSAEAVAAVAEETVAEVTAAADDRRKQQNQNSDKQAQSVQPRNKKAAAILAGSALAAFAAGKKTGGKPADSKSKQVKEKTTKGKNAAAAAGGGSSATPSRTSSTENLSQPHDGEVGHRNKPDNSTRSRATSPDEAAARPKTTGGATSFDALLDAAVSDSNTPAGSSKRSSIADVASKSLPTLQANQSGAERSQSKAKTNSQSNIDRKRSPLTKPAIGNLIGAKKLGQKWRSMIGASDEGGMMMMMSSGQMPAERAPTSSDKALVDAKMAMADSDTLPPAAPRRAKGSEVINPTVNGMRQFGISKGVISRAIVKFTGPPEPQPLTLCFHFPGTFLTHRYVLDMVRGKIQQLDGGTGVGLIATIQFIDRNTIHGTQGMDNRWLVTMTNADSLDILLQHGLHLFNRKITLRPYDEILNEEYAEFLEYKNLTNKLYAKDEEDAQTRGGGGGEGGGGGAGGATSRREDGDDGSNDEEPGAVTSRSDKQQSAINALYESGSENENDNEVVGVKSAPTGRKSSKTRGGGSGGGVRSSAASARSTKSAVSRKSPGVKR